MKGAASAVGFSKQTSFMGRHYSVIIKASETALDTGTISRRLSAFVGRAPEEVEAAVEAGTVILQRDLSYGEAIEFQRELNRRKIPTQVSREESGEGRELLLKPWKKAAEPSKQEGTREERISEVEKRGGDSKSSGSLPAETGGVSGWAELFPDLGEVSEGEEAEAVFEERSGAVAPELFEEFDELDERDELDEWGDLEELEAPEEAAGPKVGKDGPKSGAGSPRAFDSKIVEDAFSVRDERRPPFMPKGFDKRPEHLPLAAAVLTALAPGAGQVFNGQGERAQKLAVSFVLVVPWVKGVRQAFEYGEKIRTYYAPRPEKGALKRSLIFAGKWWVTMAVLITLSSWIAGSLMDYREQQRELERRVQFQYVLYFGQDVVEDAILDAREAAENAKIEEEEESGRFSMNDEERARRVFIIGYHHCKAGEYRMCEAAMRRVTSLTRENRDAFRLQTWATIRAQGEELEMEMPEVAGVPSLEEFELELSLHGENLESVTREWWDRGRNR